MSNGAHSVIGPVAPTPLINNDRPHNRSRYINFQSAITALAGFGIAESLELDAFYILGFTFVGFTVPHIIRKVSEIANKTLYPPPEVPEPREPMTRKRALDLLKISPDKENDLVFIKAQYERLRDKVIPKKPLPNSPLLNGVNGLLADIQAAYTLLSAP